MNCLISWWFWRAWKLPGLWSCIKLNQCWHLNEQTLSNNEADGANALVLDLSWTVPLRGFRHLIFNMCQVKLRWLNAVNPHRELELLHFMCVESSIIWESLDTFSATTLSRLIEWKHGLLWDWLVIGPNSSQWKYNESEFSCSPLALSWFRGLILSRT